jgi:hypothetical protein
VGHDKSFQTIAESPCLGVDSVTLPSIERPAVTNGRKNLVTWYRMPLEAKTRHEVESAYRRFLLQKFDEVMPHLQHSTPAIKRNFLKGFHQENYIDLFALEYSQASAESIAEEEIVDHLGQIGFDVLF